VKNLVYVFLLLSVSAAADEPINCNQIEDPTERLSCFDRAFPAPTQDSDDKDVAIEREVVGEVEKPAEPTDKEPADTVSTNKALNESPREGQPDNSTTSTRTSKPDHDSDNNKGLFNGGLFNTPAVNFSSTIIAIQQGDKQKMVFLLENDEIWIQSSPRPLPFREGDTVTIENATVGGYFMRTPKGTATRVKRIH